VVPDCGQLLLLRHGESTANAHDLFTGILDAPLTERGFREARAAGELIEAEGLIPDLVFVSELLRARQTATEVLDVLREPLHPLSDSRLDERNYGALTGRSKRDVRMEYGTALFHTWRRSVNIAPPPMTDEQFIAIAHALPFSELPPHALTRTESLADVMVRVRAFFDERVVPELLAGSRVLIVGHGNSLRALCAELDHLRNDEIEELNVPTGHPLLYEFSDGTPLRVERVGYLDSEAALSAAAAIARQGGT